LNDDKLLAEWFWTDRWTGSSAFLLPIAARGLYREMLTQAWRRQCRLPADPVAIQRAVGCTPQEWKRCWPKVEKYWRRDGDALVNDTQLTVWKEASAAHRRAVERARKGGNGRARGLAGSASGAA
jgi:uncharacterized protein YdaU (DUF1376 family)